MGMALCIIVIHCFGDVPATIIMGKIQEEVAGKNPDQEQTTFSWHVMFWVAEVFFILGFIFWYFAAVFADRWVLEGTPALRASLLAQTGGDEDFSPLFSPLTGGPDPPPLSNQQRNDSWDEEEEEEFLGASAVLGGAGAARRSKGSRSSIPYSPPSRSPERP